ncbi:MAG: response regulator [Candidatus Omnitrophica bacterium]|nr:response regulator [Candidatus Omnitrophota bacterium]
MAEHQQRVLICDDNATCLMMLRRILEKNGFRVVGEAKTGLDAINLYEEVKPDLVILDLNMPKGGGITALRFMRELDPMRAVDRSPSILILTSEGSQFNVETAHKLGADDFLLKSSIQKPLFVERLKALCAIDDLDDMDGADQEDDAAPRLHDSALEHSPRKTGSRMYHPEFDRRRRSRR